MLASDLISDDVPPLKITDTGDKALQWMEEFRVSHIPVIEGTQFVGIVSDDDILNMDDPDVQLGSAKISMIKPHLTATQHPYDALKLMAELGLTVLAVTDEQNNYVGAVSIQNLAVKLSQMAAIREPGGIIILEVNHVDYSLSQIASIIEGNDAKVLSMYVSSEPDSNRAEITLKINKEDLTRILQTFTRYNYTVKATFHQSEFMDDLKQRFDSFMNFMNI
ncbi:MAG: CBS domain-containing protein [Bacteroidetes bacterium]|nr:MAG: CBS domain-containing protein [Bacteroidota bacterium]